ncbi:hypothetical protein FOA43_004551 [Brettanomyces nanus]|uniref:Uncharacterized protein n=1 Tax=Eeniella nana TaxID=13502 RepID=A0A875RY25_EENNA|nr:uncharacterized protein FOA43_004551 [Brettanomyces nanus]QPG77147.1 hypothetical protein FOA43_004551 [Brettanomyces nanus]
MPQEANMIDKEVHVSRKLEDEPDEIDSEPEYETREEDEDDDFGNFEETQQQRRSLLEFDGDYEKHAETIGLLAQQMMKHMTLLEDRTEPQNSEIKLNDRCTSLYQRLVEQSPNSQLINWKQSFIKRQLLLNLQIPINLDELSPPKGDSVRVPPIYGENVIDELSLEAETELLRQVPPFDSFGMSEGEIKTLLDDTDKEMEEVYRKLQPVSYYKVLAEKNPELLGAQQTKLIGIKQELLRLLACWDKKLTDDKADNKIFTSYVENLVGNTQKLRRSSK